MSEIWKFFDELDEMVYVSDIETNELVYMNKHLLESLGFDSCIKYQGKMCYEVLQGRHAPCPFCTNLKLQEGKFISWVHKNPVLNKRFLIKDSMIVSQGRRYRIEIAIDADSETACYMPYFYVRNETILNECLQQIFSTTNPEESIEQLLVYIGNTFDCDRVYIFEIDGRRTSNTYEWCAESVIPQKELLQNVSLTGIDWWMDLFAENQVTVIENLENIRNLYPESYAVLKPQNITSLVAGPIKADGQIIGFLGVDNPDKQRRPLVEPFLNVIGYFVSSLLRRRDLLDRLNELSYHDQLTGALNRNALAEYYVQLPMKTVGVIYCDITGLKSVNDSLGHAAGDKMICHCYETIKNSVSSGKIYRTGGDEFIVLCPDCSEKEFGNMVRDLQESIRRDEHHMALGYAWSDAPVLNLEDIIVQADKVMYEDKRIYYQKYSQRLGVERRQSRLQKGDKGNGHLDTLMSSFQNFLDMAYCNVEALFKSIAEDNRSSYFYFGDMQKNLFYISDNMRDDFGFQDNIVSDLLSLWAKRISTPEFREIYWRDIFDMQEKKRVIHDLRYRVRDIKGNNKWIRCYGHMLWNEERSQPIFFSGRISCQDRQFVVDPITTLPRENASFGELNRLRMDRTKTLIIGFGLNGITELNSIKGRPYGDRLLRKVAEALMENLSTKASFYRLEGARCMAVVDPACAQEGCDDLISEIRTIIKRCYAAMEIPLPKVCSFGLMEYPCENLMPEDVVETIESLIRLAKQESEQNYIDYSVENVQRIKERSNMTLKLGEDVIHNMRNFRIMIQPITSARKKRMIGGEVLLRWNFMGEDISPAIFIPYLEKDNTIYLVGRWVFEQAVCTCVRIRAYAPDFFLTFNISLYQLSDDGLLAFMDETLKKYNLDGSGLVAELTESCLDERPEKLIHFANECQKMGIRIALDDFGSGYSSLRMMLQYPSAIIKLDRSLIREVMGSKEKMSFMRSIIFACHQFGKIVCIEGIEKEEQNEIVMDLGCDMLQGFFHYKPMELSDIYLLIGEITLESEE